MTVGWKTPVACEAGERRKDHETALLITIVLLALLPDVVKAQWTFDVVSVEAYINDHKKQRSLLLT